MDLQVVVVEGTGERHTLSVSFGDAHRVTDLSDALGAHLGTVFPQLHVQTPRGSRQLPAEALVSEVGLVRGNVLRAAPGRPSLGPTWLAVSGGPDAGRLAHLAGHDVVVGRGEDADLRLQDPFVSRRHTRLRVVGDEVFALDLDSSNGTALDGVPIAGEVEVTGQAIELGSTLVSVIQRPVAHVLPGDASGWVDLTPAVTVPVDLPAHARSAGSTDGTPRADLTAAAIDAGDRLAQRLPDMATLRIAAEDRQPLLWSRVGAPRELRVGWGPLVVDGSDGAEVLVPEAPLWVDLGAGPVHIGGEPGDARRTAGALVLQACVLHAAGELAVHAMLGADDLADWGWLHWLPHVRRGGIHHGAGESAAVLRALQAAAHGPTLVIVAGQVPSLVGGLEELAAVDGVAVVVVGGLSPSWASTSLDVGESGAVAVRTSAGVLTGMGADGVSGDVAEDVARSLAPLREPGVTRPGTGPRAEFTVLLAARGVDGIRQAWSVGRPRRTPVGTNESGVAVLPLDNGTVAVELAPGAGQALLTDALTQMVLSTAVGIGPDRLGIVLAGQVDHRLRRLPHVLSGDLDTDSLAAEVETELHRRRELLRLAGLDDWDVLRRGDPSAGPRLLVVLSQGVDLQRWSALLDSGAVLGLDTVVVGLGADAPVRLSIGAAAEALLEVHGTRTSLVIAKLELSSPVERLEVRSLDARGRPAGTGHTSLARAPADVDPVVRVVEACRLAADTASLPTWSPAPDPRALRRVRRTFVFTDIVGSTRLVEVIGDHAWADLVGWHDRTLRAVFDEHRGEEVDHAGDGFLVAFSEPADAVACAREIQRRLDEHRRDAGFAPRVRIGGHVADVVEADGYKGHGLHVAARVGALAGADEIVFSADVLASVRPSPRIVSSRSVAVKGATDPVEIRSVDWR